MNSALLALAHRPSAVLPKIPLTANEANAVAMQAARDALKGGASETEARRVFEDAYAEAVAR